MSDEKVYEILMDIREDQGRHGEKLENIEKVQVSMGERIGKVEEKVQPITWLQQTRTALLWVGGIGGGVTVVWKLVAVAQAFVQGG